MDEYFWVFAYGSLMWQPGFAYDEAVPAKLHGWHRAMCLLSLHYRGTAEAPGLVLGLDRGGSCQGIAFRTDATKGEAVRAYLHEREMITGVYRPRLAPVRLADGRRVSAYTFVARRDHPQYAGQLARPQAVALIRQGVGGKGTCRDYLATTVAHLDALHLHDENLHGLLRQVDRA